MSERPETIPSACYVSERFFREEQHALSRLWHFVCLTDDVTEDSQWVHRQVCGVDLFVQNFRGDLRAFSNVCRHRGFPVRREACGVGHAQCQYHGWVYNRDGVPGIARNEELFGLSRDRVEQLALPRYRVETAGKFVFVTTSPDAPPLEASLGRMADVLRALSQHTGTPTHTLSFDRHSNWKLAYEITLDDYHLKTIHPSTFGAQDPNPSKLFYGREGDHSFMFTRRDDDWPFATFWDDARAGRYDFTGYKIFQLFPTTLVASTRASVVVSTFRPASTLLTRCDDVMLPVTADGQGPADLDSIWASHCTVVSEDVAATDALQRTIGQLSRSPTFGKLEERVRWFHQSYLERIFRNTDAASLDAF